AGKRCDAEVRKVDEGIERAGTRKRMGRSQWGTDRQVLHVKRQLVCRGIDAKGRIGPKRALDAGINRRDGGIDLVRLRGIAIAAFANTLDAITIGIIEAVQMA